MLFYYFNSKQELYSDLLDRALDYMQTSLLPRLGDGHAGIIEAYMHASMVKLQAYQDMPHLLAFIGRVFLADDTQHMTAVQLEQMRRLRCNGLEGLMDHADMSDIRPDIPIDVAKQLIRYCMDGYAQDLTQRLRHAAANVDYTSYWEEFHAYLDVLRMLFYNQTLKEKL